MAEPVEWRSFASKYGTTPNVRHVSGECEDRRTAKAARAHHKARTTKTLISDPEKKRKTKFKLKTTKVVTHKMLTTIVTNSEGHSGSTPRPDNIPGNSVQNATPTDGHGTEPPQDTPPGV